MGLKVSVDNSEPTEGGSDRLVRSPDTADRVRLRTRLVEKLTAQAKEDIRTRLGDPAAMVETTLAVREILEEKVSSEIGHPADILEMSLRVEFQASFIEETDLQALARMALEANLPGGFERANESILIQPVEELRLDSEGRLVGTIQASRWLVSPVQTSQVAEQVKGKPIQTAIREMTSAYKLEQPPQVSIIPGWWPFLPFFNQRIRVSNQPG